MTTSSIEKKVKHSNLVCLPGQRLCLSDENTVAGQGTYERMGYIYATLAGTVNIREKDNVFEKLFPMLDRLIDI